MQSKPNGTHDLAAENAALRAELARYRTLVDQMALGVYVYRLEDRADDRSLRMVAANQAVAALTGVPTSTQIGKTIDENFPSLREQGIAHAYAEAVRTGQPFDQQVTYGTEHTLASAFAVRALPLPNDELAVCFEHITARKQAELMQAGQALRESQALFQTLFEHLPVPVMLKAAADGRYILWNSACQRLLGVPASKVIGKTDHDLFPKAIADDLWAKHQAVHAAGVPITQLEELVSSPNTPPIPASITRVPILDEAGMLRYVLIIVNDLTEQKRALDERESLQSQIIEAQQSALQELSTPLLPLSNKVVLMPIVGAMDSRRAQQVVETLLEGVSQYNAEIAILDITGVQVVDTQVANAFIQSARAVQLLGARVMLTGIRPEVAQTLVQLGVDLQGMLTRGSLQSGIAYAFNR
jgi:PAS domain S-box-containing protein